MKSGKTLWDELAGKMFDASHLANGIYFYTLRARDFIKTRKMSIIK